MTRACDAGRRAAAEKPHPTCSGALFTRVLQGSARVATGFQSS